MSQQITTATDRPGPPTVDPELAKLSANLICWTSSDPAQPVGLSRSLTADERRQVSARLADLNETITGRNQQAVRQAITALMMAYPSSRASGDEAKAILTAYEYALGDVPAWAVLAAVQRYIRGQVQSANAAFAPSSAELRIEAERDVKPFVEERERLSRLLIGVSRDRDVGADERARVAERLAALRDELGTSIKADREKRLERTRAALQRGNERAFAQECAATGMDPAQGVSPSLLKTLQQPMKAARRDAAPTERDADDAFDHLSYETENRR